MLKNSLGAFSGYVYRATSTAGATGLAVLAAIAWAAAGPRMHFSSLWILLMSGLSSVVTLVMVFVLNYAQSRDTAAINAKLDSLIFAVEHADNRLIGMETLPAGEAEQIHEEVVAVLHDEARNDPAESG